MVYDGGMDYTVKQLATLAGISPRTLRFYDEIGLLKPEKVGENRYRYYGEESLLRLQQILFYRELDLDLGKIRQIMEDGKYSGVKALEEHRRALEKRIERYQRLIETIDETILHVQGEKRMDDKSLFKPSQKRSRKHTRGRQSNCMTRRL